ncbi:MAG: flagellar biosynthetic protein FliO [Acidobacteria bacterium]|nr:flagellar biosynthetic protein FliO [Acidobacteriota bacterium]
MQLVISSKQRWLIIGGVVLLGLALLVPSGARTAEHEPSLSGLAMRAAGSLLVVLALLLGAAYVARTYGLAGVGNARNTGRLKIEERLAFGGRQTISIVRYGKHRYLVGSDQNGLKLLTEIPRQSGDDKLEVAECRTPDATAVGRS